LYLINQVFKSWRNELICQKLLNKYRQREEKWKCRSREIAEPLTFESGKFNGAYIEFKSYEW